MAFKTNGSNSRDDQSDTNGSTSGDESESDHTFSRCGREVILPWRYRKEPVIMRGGKTVRAQLENNREWSKSVQENANQTAIDLQKIRKEQNGSSEMKSMGAENFHPEQNLEEQIESTTTIREILKRNTYREDNEEQNYSMEHNGVTSGVGGKFQRVPPNETREPDEVVDDLTVTGSVILEASRARDNSNPDGITDSIKSFPKGVPNEVDEGKTKLSENKSADGGTNHKFNRTTGSVVSENQYGQNGFQHQSTEEVLSALLARSTKTYEGNGNQDEPLSRDTEGVTRGVPCHANTSGNYLLEEETNPSSVTRGVPCHANTSGNYLLEEETNPSSTPEPIQEPDHSPGDSSDINKIARSIKTYEGNGNQDEPLSRDTEGVTRGVPCHANTSGTYLLEEQTNPSRTPDLIQEPDHSPGDSSDIIKIDSTTGDENNNSDFGNETNNPDLEDDTNGSITGDENRDLNRGNHMNDSTTGEENTHQKRFTRFDREVKLPTRYQKDYILNIHEIKRINNIRMAHPHETAWEKAEEDEIRKFNEMEVYEEVPIPSGSILIPMLFVYTFKEDDLKGEVYKARAVVQGYRQQEGIHFNKYRVSSPVADLSSIRILTSIATEANYPIHHLDIKSAYLNASLPEGEEIYVRPPRGFSSKDGYCWKLKKSVYGIKQSGHDWYMCLADKLKKIGLRPLGSQGTISTKQSIVGNIIIAIYVDDLFLVGKNEQVLKEFKKDHRGII
ncbi:hypothetical protein JCM33374_g6634 [Metschnikowia sp. JCM 33374]|nr:hypothetical protein JCM33374_g6634 [Metschnikowia sp. JCM 33374]